jgi:hypothetical protein
MRVLGLFAVRVRMVERSRFQTFAARLLPKLTHRRSTGRGTGSCSYARCQSKDPLSMKKGRASISRLSCIAQLGRVPRSWVASGAHLSIASSGRTRPIGVRSGGASP